MPVRPVYSLILLAVLCTGLNALKPIQIDDTAYDYYARQMAAQPLDPYGFSIFWYEEPQPANEVLAPPLFPYSWALVRRLVGERPWLWKLGLLPWALLLVAALYSLFRRFALGLEQECTWAFVLSPLLLPSINLMLDVPALALSLASVVLFLRGCDRSSFGLAAAAGLLAGLAMQTKYTGVLAPGVMLLYALRARKLHLWPAAALVAAQVFLTWELLIALLYGDSHFLLALANSTGWISHLLCLPPLLPCLGGVAGVGVLMGLASLGVRRRWLLLGAGGVIGVYVAVVLVSGHIVVTDRLSPLVGLPSTGSAQVELAEPLFYAVGLSGLVVMVLVVRRLLHSDKPDASDGETRRETLFLIGWLVLEVLGYFQLTPFPALRRVLGLGTVLALLLGRLLARTCRDGAPRRTFRALVLANVALGLAFFALDTWGARLQQRAAEAAAAWIAAHRDATDRGTHRRVWFLGHWGFQFYAARQGMRPLVPGTALQRGDWIVIPDVWLEQQHPMLEADRLELMAKLDVDGGLPLRTVPDLYGGRTPLAHPEAPGLEVRIFRVRAPFRLPGAEEEVRGPDLLPAAEFPQASLPPAPAHPPRLLLPGETAAGARGLTTNRQRTPVGNNRSC